MNTITIPLVTFILGIGILGTEIQQSPVVEFDRQTSKCLKVEAKNPVYDCSNLPSSYQTKWQN